MVQALDGAVCRVLGAAIVVACSVLGSACVSQLDNLKRDWTARSTGGPPCGDVADCRGLLRQLDQTRREVCEDDPACEEIAELDQDIREAVQARFQEPCERGDATACLAAREFGFEQGLIIACDRADPQACAAACAEGTGKPGGFCRATAEDLRRLQSRCAFKHEDTAVACRTLGLLVRHMSARAASAPPRPLEGHPSLYATPLLPDRPRSRYALDYLSRACHLGDRTACRALCEPRVDERDDATEARSSCQRIVREETAKSLQVRCRQREGEACRDLAVLYARMGFFDRDPAGFFITGPGRVVGLNAMACQLGVQDVCGQDSW